MGLYSRNNRTNNFVADLLSNTDFQTITARQRNDNLSYNQESTAQIDYQTPIKKNQLLEFGGKGIFRQVNSDYKYYNASPDGAYVEDKTRPANTLFYDQNVTSGYLSYTYASRSKWTVKAGGRYEYTFIDAKFSNEQAGKLSDIPDYGTFVPSINLSKGLRGGKSIKAAYNRRIQRPGLQQLNPNFNAANPQNITIGNPALRPEFAAAVVGRRDLCPVQLHCEFQTGSSGRRSLDAIGSLLPVAGGNAAARQERGLAPAIAGSDPA